MPTNAESVKLTLLQEQIDPSDIDPFQNVIVRDRWVVVPAEKLWRDRVVDVRPRKLGE